MIKKISLRHYGAYASVAVALILIAAKLAAYWQTDSVAVLSSLLDSSIDSLASLVTLFGIRTAQKPADEDHRYGHGKAEGLAAMAQAAFIMGAAVFLVIESSSRLVHPVTLDYEGAGIAVMVFSCVLTALLLWFQGKVVRETGSIAIKADRFHYAGDIAVNIAVIIALLLNSLFDWRYIDGLFGLGIALYLLRSVFHIAREAGDLLMDRELPDEEREKIMALVQSRQGVRGIHDLRTRSSGTHIFIEFHLELDGLMSLNAAHNITDIVEQTLRAAYPTGEIIIHQEPAGIHDERLDDRIQEGD